MRTVLVCILLATVGCTQSFGSEGGGHTDEAPQPGPAVAGCPADMTMAFRGSDVACVDREPVARVDFLNIGNAPYAVELGGACQAEHAEPPAGEVARVGWCDAVAYCLSFGKVLCGDDWSVVCTAKEPPKGSEWSDTCVEKGCIQSSCGEAAVRPRTDLAPFRCCLSPRVEP